MNKGITNIPVHTGFLTVVIPLSAQYCFTEFSILSDDLRWWAHYTHLTMMDVSLFVSYLLHLHLSWVLLVPPEGWLFTSQVKLWLWVPSEKKPQRMENSSPVGWLLQVWTSPHLDPPKKKEQKHLFFGQFLCLVVFVVTHRFYRRWAPLLEACCSTAQEELRLPFSCTFLLSWGVGAETPTPQDMYGLEFIHFLIHYYHWSANAFSVDDWMGKLAPLLYCHSSLLSSPTGKQYNVLHMYVM